jgi:hypothetical protein
MIEGLSPITLKDSVNRQYLGENRRVMQYRWKYVANT